MDISHEITKALSEHPETSGSIIEVINERGFVTLKGKVKTRSAKDKAEEIARQTEGVLSVINEIRAG